MVHPYFGQLGACREALLWAEGTRLQLVRWETLVARIIRAEMSNRAESPADVWQAQIEHHFCLVAAAHMLSAGDLLSPKFTVSQLIRDQIREGRDLHEHWVENMPMFNDQGKPPTPKYPSGQRFAARHPGRSPYWWLGYGGRTGALVMPELTAPQVHEVIDQLESRVLADRPELAQYQLERAESPWTTSPQRGGWWPRKDH